MIDFLINNLSTVIVVLITAVILVLCVIGTVKTKGRCSQGCTGCMYKASCKSKSKH